MNCHYAGRTLAWPVSTRLDLPECWTNDPPRRESAQVPAEVVFQTKAEIALALVDEANTLGVPPSCVCRGRRGLWR